MQPAVAEPMLVQAAIAFMLVSLRFLGLFLAAPVLAFRAVPLRLRLSVCLVLGVSMLPQAMPWAAELVREIPFAQPTPMLVFEFKVLVLIGIFVYAFFRFSWSMRLYTFVALALGAMAPVPQYQADPEAAEA